MAAEYLGAHVSTGKGMSEALLAAHADGFTAIQVFTSSPRMWKSVFPSQEKIASFLNAKQKTGIPHVISHDSYLVNLCHRDEEVTLRSISALKDELVRSSALGIGCVVSHIGSVGGQDVGSSFLRIADNVNEILAETPDDVTLCMETTAGQGSDVNSKFEEIAILFELLGETKRIGVCLDTCHVFASGYDISTEEGYRDAFNRFEQLIGIDKLRVLHLNDSKKGLGSRVDRHENIGKGQIGIATFGFIVNDPRLSKVPMVVETPHENEGHQTDIRTLRSLIKSPAV